MFINIDFDTKNILRCKYSLTREHFAEALGKKGKSKEAVRVLMLMLDDSYHGVRSAAIDALEEIGNKRHIPKILPFLDDKDELVRVAAVEYLCKLGGRKEAKYLVKYLDDKSALVRGYVGATIGVIGDKSNIKYLEKRLRKEHRNLARIGLTEGLYDLGQEERLDEIIKLLKCRYYVIRCRAAHALDCYIVEENKEMILEVLNKALKNEPTVAVKSTIEIILKDIKEWQ